MIKFIEILSAIAKILPLLVESVELFSQGDKQGAVKKEIVKRVVQDYVTKDPAYEPMIDIMIDKAVEKGLHTGGSRTNHVKGKIKGLTSSPD